MFLLNSSMFPFLSYPPHCLDLTSHKGKTKANEPTDNSQTKPKIKVKEIGLILYYTKSSRYLIDLHHQEGKEILRDL